MHLFKIFILSRMLVKSDIQTTWDNNIETIVFSPDHAQNTAETNYFKSSYCGFCKLLPKIKNFVSIKFTEPENKKQKLEIKVVFTGNQMLDTVNLYISDECFTNILRNFNLESKILRKDSKYEISEMNEHFKNCIVSTKNQKHYILCLKDKHNGLYLIKKSADRVMLEFLATSQTKTGKSFYIVCKTYQSSMASHYDSELKTVWIRSKIIKYLDYERIKANKEPFLVSLNDN